jgi:hypothetical protein
MAKLKLAIKGAARLPNARVQLECAHLYWNVSPAPKRNRLPSAFCEIMAAHVLPITCFSLSAFGAEMVESPKNQLRNDESGEHVTGAVLSHRPEGRRKSRLATTALIVVLGLGVGWIAGKFISRSPIESPPATDVSAGIDSATPSPGQSQSRPPAKHESVAETSASPPTSPLVPPPPVVRSETPPQVPRVEKEEEPAVEPPAEGSEKEVGPEALKKISKEIRKMHRGKPLGKSNANEDFRQ